MKIIIRGNEFVKLSENAKQHIQERVGELEKLFNKSENPCATVFCKGKALDRNEVSVEITIPMKHLILRSECSDETLYGALELAIDKIEKQLLRHKKKVETMIHKREGIAYAFSDFVEDNQEPEEELEPIRVKKMLFVPMTVEEAITQMDLIDHDFFVFMDESSYKIKVVYVRKDGGYGLIEQE